MVQIFRQAARNAIDAGFDGVEVHGANVSAAVFFFPFFFKFVHGPVMPRSLLSGCKQIICA